MKNSQKLENKGELPQLDKEHVEKPQLKSGKIVKI